MIEKRSLSRLEKFFLLFLFINPFLDLLSGIYIYYSAVFGLPAVTPSLFVRLFVLALFALYMIKTRDKYALITVGLCALAWVMSLIGQCVYFYSFDLKEDFTYIVKFIYNLSALLVYYRIIRRTGMEKDEVYSLSRRVFCFTPFVLSLSIIICYILGLGYRTYGDRFGYFGSRGFFYSGNDITAVLMLLLFITMLFFFTSDRRELTRFQYIYMLASPAFSIVTLLLIGTKTAFIAVAAALFAAGLYSLIVLFKDKSGKALLKLILLIISVALIFSVLIFFRGSDVAGNIAASLGHIGDIYEEQGDLTNTIFSGRQYKLKKAFSMWKSELYFTLFGTGRGSHARIIEMDIFEILFYYGVFGFVVLLFTYVYTTVRVTLSFFKKPGREGIFVLGSLAVCAGYFLIAGHVLFSVTSGFYFSLVLLFAANRYITPMTLYPKEDRERGVIRADG
ncbi:MAG: O-antigen ligase family protein [Clostridia bacterium]|nr:O-antigen ligase family protein [Clostridia bacterium]